MSVPLPSEWVEGFGLSHRRPPEFFQSSEEIGTAPHAGALRVAFEDLRLSAVFCVQDVPTIAFLAQDGYDREAVADIHKALWNQGLASLLLVITQDTVRIFSLVRFPKQDPGEDIENQRLIQTLQLIGDALKLKELVLGTESGRWWKEHEKFFNKKERIDYVLLDNLDESFDLLCDKNLPSIAAQALLMQTMFIAYLEDRDIVTPEDFQEVSAGKVDNFTNLLLTGKPKLFVDLFAHLRDRFNGDLFVAPCSFDPKQPAPALEVAHLSVLARFRTGKEEMRYRQTRFWGYDFRYVPVELISAVYDRFLGEREEERGDEGAYYTPMFLADTVVGQVWGQLSEKARIEGIFLDPACGSGIFLVRMFQRCVEHWRVTHGRQTVPWPSLMAIFRRINGWDTNSNAVRIAIFSLYIALLEQVTTPAIRDQFERGHILPELWGKKLVHQNFFDVPGNDEVFDVVIGNPPWKSRSGQERSAIRWCNENGYPIPGGEDAWGFSWKVLQHISDDGLVAFLLPAMGMLHNHQPKTVDARRRFLNEAQLLRVINFSDMRFQLFDGAVAPTALFLYRTAEKEGKTYRFDYWTPKADLNLRLKRVITLSSADRAILRSDVASSDPLVFKRRFWMRGPDIKLHKYLSSLPPLGELIREYVYFSRRRQPADCGWVVGQGFTIANPDRLGDPKYKIYESEVVGRLPFLSIDNYQPIVLPTMKTKAWRTSQVHWLGFEVGYFGPRIFLPQGIDTKNGRLRASYTEQDLSFTQSLQAVTVPRDETDKGKLLTAVLNSRLVSWFVFHDTANFGVGRPKVDQTELLRIPFPSPEDLPNPKSAKRAAEKIVALMEKLLTRRDELFVNGGASMADLDSLVYQYFGLSEDEIAVIEDAFEYIIPAMQPHESAFPRLWKAVGQKERVRYAETLVTALGDWFEGEWQVKASLEGYGENLAVVRLRLVEDGRDGRYVENEGQSLEAILRRIWDHLPTALSGNFQLVPDLRLFMDRDLYLIKPMQLRFWLRSSALADASSIAADLQSALAPERRIGRA